MQDLEKNCVCAFRNYVVFDVGYFKVFVGERKLHQINNIASESIRKNFYFIRKINVSELFQSSNTYLRNFNCII